MSYRRFKLKIPAETWHSTTPTLMFLIKGWPGTSTKQAHRQLKNPTTDYSFLNMKEYLEEEINRSLFDDEIKWLRIGFPDKSNS